MSNIEWTDVTWNPVTGCSRVSPGCDNCYMFDMYPRLHAMGANGYEYAPDVVQLLPDRLDKPMQWRKPRMVFVNSMSDLFHNEVPFEFISEVYSVMDYAATLRGHVFQVLTKRPGRAAYWWEHYGNGREWNPNVWIGTSIENQKYANRIDVLERIPAPVRFISAEPLLGHLDISEWLERDALQWVICGGESGNNARPMNPDWCIDLLAQCQESEVPFFFKQWGGVRDKRGGDEAVLNGRIWQQMPIEWEGGNVLSG